MTKQTQAANEATLVAEPSEPLRARLNTGPCGEQTKAGNETKLRRSASCASEYTQTTSRTASSSALDQARQHRNCWVFREDFGERLKQIESCLAMVTKFVGNCDNSLAVQVNMTKLIELKTKLKLSQ